MKDKIHPTYYPKAKVSCACGSTFTVGSTMENIKVEICSACHPFYTGQEKVIDTAGRVEKFKARRKTADEKKATAKPKNKKTKKQENKETKKQENPTSPRATNGHSKKAADPK